VSNQWDLAWRFFSFDVEIVGISSTSAAPATEATPTAQSRVVRRVDFGHSERLVVATLRRQRVGRSSGTGCGGTVPLDAARVAMWWFRVPGRGGLPQEQERSRFWLR
jgi:hypothetical protein